MFLHIKQLKHVLVISGLFCTVIAEGSYLKRATRFVTQPHLFFPNSTRLPVVLYNSLQRRLCSSNNTGFPNTDNALVLWKKPEDALVPCGEMIDNISGTRKNGEEAEEGSNVEHLERAMRVLKSVLLGLACSSSFIAGYQIAALTEEKPAENNYEVELLEYDVNYLTKEYVIIPGHYYAPCYFLFFPV